MHDSRRTGWSGPFTYFAACAALLSCEVLPAADWQPAEGRMMTRWGKEYTAGNAVERVQELGYPRPQLQREDWHSLNGLWDYAIRPKEEGKPDSWDGEILVPFAAESALSGVMKNVGTENRLWYRRTFTVPGTFKYPRILLHFGAVDWHATVWVDGKQLGEHKGGYDPFSFDITDAIEFSPVGVPGGQPREHEIIVSVWDPSDAGFQPRGKQVQKPHGIWYTPVTGIWQTVWLEPVNPSRVADLLLVPDIDQGVLHVTAHIVGAKSGETVEFTARQGDSRIARETVTLQARGGDEVGEATTKLPIRDAKLWSPDDPFLYDLDVRILSGPQMEVDHVTSYFGMRKIEVRKDEDGVNRLFLNNAPLFQFGPLDQGWWPDGLYTAPTDEALKYDIEITKQLGYNMARKHVKVEPDRWYYWCDKLGLLVWQDMPNGDRHIRQQDPDIERSPESEETYRREWQAIIDARRDHPSIVAWVPFNEGWGQFETNEILAWTKKYDASRLVDGPSGWTDRGGGDMHDMHRYPGPDMPPLEDGRAAVLGEYGGLGLPLEGHTWLDKGNWGYRTFESREALVAAYKRLIEQLHPLIGEGLAAAIYTQTTDVEIEVNGFMTYDREVIKLPEDIAELHATLYGPPPKTVTVVPGSRRRPQEWKYTTLKPADGWQQSEFDDSGWKAGPGGFGTEGTPGTAVRTEWNTPDIWLRRTFELDDADLEHPYLRMHHDENAEVYINGERAAKVEGYTVSYVLIPIDETARGALRPGKNTLAVHCRQTGGGQYIDVGVVDVRSPPAAKSSSTR